MVRNIFMQIKTILVFVQFHDGTVHQVVATDEQRRHCLLELRNPDTRKLEVLDRIEPIIIDDKDHSANPDKN